VHDISQIHHSPEQWDAAIQGSMDSGRRAAFGYFESAGGVPGNQYPDDARRIKKQWFSSDDQLVTMIMGGEVYLPGFDMAWAIGRELGLQVAAHILSPFGIRPTFDTLAATNQFGPDNLFVHMTGMSDMAWQKVIPRLRNSALDGRLAVCAVGNDVEQVETASAGEAVAADPDDQSSQRVRDGRVLLKAPATWEGMQFMAFFSFEDAEPVKQGDPERAGLTSVKLQLRESDPGAAARLLEVMKRSYGWPNATHIGRGTRIMWWRSGNDEISYMEATKESLVQPTTSIVFSSLTIARPTQPNRRVPRRMPTDQG